MNIEELVKSIPEHWRDRINSDSKFFKAPNKARPHLFTLYANATNIHDRLIKIANEELERVNGDWNNDKFLREMYFIRKETRRIEKELGQQARRAFQYLDSFEAQNQINALNFMVLHMPITQAKTIDQLKQSPTGLLQFPRRYLTGISMTSSYTSKMLKREGIPWTPKEFEKAIQAYLSEETGFSGSSNINAYVIERKTFPGSTRN